MRNREIEREREGEREARPVKENKDWARTKQLKKLKERLRLRQRKRKKEAHILKTPLHNLSSIWPSWLTIFACSEGSATVNKEEER